MTERPAKPVRFGDLGVRMCSAAGLAVVSFFCIWMGQGWSAVLVAFLSVMMQWEYRQIVTGDATLAAPGLLTVIACNLVALALVLSGFGLWGLVLAFAGSILPYLVNRSCPLYLVPGAAYIGVALCALLMLRGREGDGFQIILWIVLVVIASDVGAFFVGRSVGGAKLWPRVSPGKTRSGAIGGLVLAAFVGWLLALVFGWNTVSALVLSLFVATGSQLGDLLESAVKRKHGIKDSSRLIPGHGGFLDRFDGIIGGTWVFLAFDLAGFHLVNV